MKQIATIAALLSDETRTTMLVCLLTGKALTAGELARAANVLPQTASMHLSKLLQANLINCTAAGRHRYYHLANAEVAQVIESIALLTPAQVITKPGFNKASVELCFARTCYDHLAGSLGVNLTQALIRRGYFFQEDKQFILTRMGDVFFSSLGIDSAKLRQQKRVFAKCCMDWTERQYHLAGALGSNLLNSLLAKHWIIKAKQGRAVFLTAEGRRIFVNDLGLRL